MLERSKNKQKLNMSVLLPQNNSGFSLVEIIIAVAILSIIFTPVLKSFLTAAIVNSKAQVTQNATSLAETVMEEVKSTSIKNLCLPATDTLVPKPEFATGGSIEFYQLDSLGTEVAIADAADFDSATKPKAPYRIKYLSVTATQGRKYDVIVDIDNSKYKNDTAGVEDASNINFVELPKLYDVQNSKEHAVLSWELNKHDGNAFHNLIEENMVLDSEETTLASTIKSSGKKTTEIILNGSGNNVTVTCDSVYSVGVYNGDGSEKYSTLGYNVYTGHLATLPTTNNYGGGPHIYLFYAMMPINCSDYFPHEVIDITDKTTDGIHNIYLMLQDEDGANARIKNLQYNFGGRTADLTINVNGSKVVGPGILTKTQWDINPKIKMYTNLRNGDGSISGNLYEEKAKDRVYYVTVSVYEQGKTDDASRLAQLVSTMESGKEADN